MESKEMNRTVVFLDGGLGKIICSTSVMNKMKEKYGEVILVSGYPEVYWNNLNVFRTLHFQHSYLYVDYVKDCGVIKSEPYLTNEYRLQDKHLIEAYCRVLGIEYNENMKPEIYLSPQEETEAINYKRQIGEYILLQIEGGRFWQNPLQVKTNKARDYPMELAQKFVDLFNEKYKGKIKIIQISLPTESLLKNVINMTNLPSRLIFPLMKHCESFVVIDSFLNHLSAAFNKKGVVLFSATSPKRLGYLHNTNLVSDYSCRFCHKTDYVSHLGGNAFSCEKNYECAKFKPEKILEELSKIIDTCKENSLKGV